jgi:hypothetical protein
MYVKLSDSGLPLEVKEHLNEDESHDRSWKDSWHWKSFEQVEGMARYLTAMTGKTHIGVDHGPHISPRFEIIQPPKVGDEVSRGFNGDYYPCGKIVKITKGWRITTSEGIVFNRRKQTATWVETGGGPFCLVPGVRNESNPHF